MHEPRVVVLGGTGQLGAALLDELARRGRASIAPPRGTLDLLRPGAVDAWPELARAAAVINAAAYTDVAGAEASAAGHAVWRLNRDLPGELARRCRRLGLRLAHVSTDYVFDGTADRPYREDDPTGPLQVYGRSKLEGEQRVLQEHPQALVVRTSTLFGRANRPRRNYVDAVLQQARRAGAVLELVRAPVGSPTLAADLAAALVDLLDAGAGGVVHAVNRGACSRIELASAALELAGRAVDVRERPEPGGVPRRPAYSALDPSRCERWIGRAMRPWREALADYVRG
jgi:dTDP-4-dehydrorhamnose reductase